MAAGRAGEELPWLVYLEGGPGFGARRFVGTEAWLGRALREFRVLLLDQRGTGLSTPPTGRPSRCAAARANRPTTWPTSAPTRSSGTASVIRSRLTGGAPWTVLGQSSAGTARPLPLRRARRPRGGPHHRRAALAGRPRGRRVPGRVPPYRAEGRRALRPLSPGRRAGPRDRRVPGRAPSRERRVPADARTLPVARPHAGRRQRQPPAPLPAGERVRPHPARHRALRRLPGGPALRVLVRRAPALRPHPRVDLRIRRARHRLVGRAGARRVPQFDAATALAGDGPVTLSPARPSTPGTSTSTRRCARCARPRELLARRTGWPALYDPERPAANEVPVAAAVYHDDMYVDTEHSPRTAAATRGLRTWVTNEYEHGRRAHRLTARPGPAAGDGQGQDGDRRRAAVEPPERSAAHEVPYEWPGCSCCSGTAACCMLAEQPIVVLRAGERPPMLRHPRRRNRFAVPARMDQPVRASSGLRPQGERMHVRAKPKSGLRGLR
ncbi:hypothetical protein SMICM17S_12249 [Streptomyces microflavus]